MSAETAVIVSGSIVATIAWATVEICLILRARANAIDPAARLYWVSLSRARFPDRQDEIGIQPGTPTEPDSYPDREFIASATTPAQAWANAQFVLSMRINTLARLLEKASREYERAAWRVESKERAEKDRMEIERKMI